MKLMEFSRYKKLMEYLEPYTLALNKHEMLLLKDESRKEKRSPSLHNIVQTNFPINYCFEHISSGFILCYSNRFMNTITLYENCVRNNPQKFQGGDSISIIKVLYDSSKYLGCIIEYDKYLRTEACCYVVRTQNDTFGEILRIDLFRMHKKERNKYVFIGGLFHCLKHFSIDNNNLCNNNDINNTFDIMHIVYLIGHAFCNAKKENSLVCNFFSDVKHPYIAAFYLEKESGVYFIDTIHRTKISTSKLKH